MGAYRLRNTKDWRTQYEWGNNSTETVVRNRIFGIDSDLLGINEKITKLTVPTAKGEMEEQTRELNWEIHCQLHYLTYH